MMLHVVQKNNVVLLTSQRCPFRYVLRGVTRRQILPLAHTRTGNDLDDKNVKRRERNALHSGKFDIHLGRVARKSVNANLGLKVNRSVNFSYIKMFLTAYVLCSLRLFKFKIEGQTI